jgi:hypothetical protein
MTAHIQAFWFSPRPKHDLLWLWDMRFKRGLAISISSTGVWTDKYVCENEKTIFFIKKTAQQHKKATGYTSSLSISPLHGM